MGSKLDYYQILGLVDKQQARHISTDELRQAYKRALLAQHPDKKAFLSPASEAAGVTIDEIGEAYRVLGDAKLRAEYDHEIKAQRAFLEDAEEGTRHTGMETLDLGELEFDAGSEQWIRSCRCGSVPAFLITEAELEKNVEYGELVTGCKGCSLWLKVLFSVES